MILKPEDATFLIKETHSRGTVLIGGQAVAFWANHFGIKARLPALTEDIDYLGTKAEARRTSGRLSLPHRIRVAKPDDATPSAAVLSIRMEGYPDPVLIDYLAAIIGLDSNAIARSAVLVEYDGHPIRILHPIQLLQSKIWNLHGLESKRTAEGVEQARLAIEIVAAYVENAGMKKREMLQAVEAIGRFAATAPARYVRDRFDLDCLKAVPESVLAPGVLPEAFREKRWPRIQAQAK